MTPAATATLPARPATSDGGRMPVLDSLRGAAILSVFAYHAFFWSGMRVDTWPARLVALLTRPAWLGVDLFFVLSGFLITGRLLDRRHLAPRQYFAGFYARRARRILPLYFSTLVIIGSLMWWAGETSWSFLLASAVFLPNIALIAGVGTSAPLAVLWSLGIEEQVYLVWPLLVSALTLRRLAVLFVAVGLAEPILRYTTFSLGVMRGGLSLATWLRLDGFAWGGLLAVLMRDARFTRTRLAAVGAGAIATALGITVACLAAGSFSRRTGLGSAAQLACADLFFAGLVAIAVCRVPGTTRHSVLASFGRISYCLYLVHQFAFWSFDRLADIRAPLPFGPIVLRAVIVLAVSTAVAELSWRYVEGPSLERRPAIGEPAVVKSSRCAS